MKKLLTICIISILAFLNAVYLTIQNYKIEQAVDKWSVSSFCDLNNSFSCTTVLSSPYSKVFWLPFPAIAMIVYPIIFALAFLGMQRVIRKPFHILTALWIWWTLFNSYFISQEFLYIWSFCPLCLLCTIMILSIAIISIFGIYSNFGKEPKKWIIWKVKDKLRMK